MLLQVDFYKVTGKWYAGGEVECDKLPWETGVLDSVLQNQKILSGTGRNFIIVLSDLSKSEQDRNYKMTYSRIYLPNKELIEQIKLKLLQELWDLFCATINKLEVLQEDIPFNPKVSSLCIDTPEAKQLRNRLTSAGVKI